jgi:hypothetical protein
MSHCDRCKKHESTHIGISRYCYGGRGESYRPAPQGPGEASESVQLTTPKTCGVHHPHPDPICKYCRQASAPPPGGDLREAVRRVVVGWDKWDTDCRTPPPAEWIRATKALAEVLGGAPAIETTLHITEDTPRELRESLEHLAREAHKTATLGGVQAPPPPEAGKEIPSGYFHNSLLISRKSDQEAEGKWLMWSDNHTVVVRLDGYAIIPMEQYRELTAKPAPEGAPPTGRAG